MAGRRLPRRNLAGPAPSRTGLARPGLSLLEIVVVVAILGVLALAAVPYAELTYVRANETQLEEGLRTIRDALAVWKKECENAAMRSLGREKFNQVQECYFYLKEETAAGKHPLGKLLETKDETISGFTYDGAAFSFTFYHLPYLRTIPGDPFVGMATWTLHFASEPTRIGIFDVSPVASNVVSAGQPVRRGFNEAIDGTLYESW